MNKLVGVRWGDLLDVTKGDLLERANCINGIDGDLTNEGECIVDLTNELSVVGEIINDEIVINDDAIIYNPEEGIILEPKRINFEINDIMTVNEAAKIFNIAESTIRYGIEVKKFIAGVDYRKAGRITLITKDAIVREYGEPKID